MPGAYASITTSVTSKGKDHEIVEKHTEALGIFLSMVSPVTWDFSGIKRVYFRSKVKVGQKKQKGIPDPRTLLFRLAQLESFRLEKIPHSTKAWEHSTAVSIKPRWWSGWGWGSGERRAMRRQIWPPFTVSIFSV